MAQIKDFEGVTAWADFKARLLLKQSKIQELSLLGGEYTLFFTENTDLYRVSITKTSADGIDYETNFQPTANEKTEVDVNVVSTTPGQMKIEGVLSGNLAEVSVDNRLLVDASIAPVSNQPISFADGPNIDAFDRLRVSEVTSLLDIKLLNDDDPLFIDTELFGTATSVYNTNEASVTMSTLADGDWAIRQTFQRTNYQSGKSQLIFMTAYNFQPETNITKRLGYYSSSTAEPHTQDLDGLWVESSGGDVSINIYRSGIQTEKTTQLNWNIDKLDGTGPSGINIDWSKNQIFIKDFEWLGVGRVRWGIVVDGMIHYFHQSVHANITSKVYMSSPNQPLRWEIRQNGAGSGNMTHICASVNSEGSLNVLGTERSFNTGNTKLSANSSGTRYALMGLRLDNGRPNIIIDILSLSVLVSTADNFLWELYLNPDVTGVFTWNNINDSTAQIALGTNTNIVSNGTLITSGYGTKESSFATQIKTALKLGSNIDARVDEFVVTITPLSNNLSAYGAMTFREVR